MGRGLPGIEIREVSTWPAAVPHGPGPGLREAPGGRLGALLCLSAADADVAHVEKLAEWRVARGRSAASGGRPGGPGSVASEKAGLPSVLSLSVLSLV